MNLRFHRHTAHRDAIGWTLIVALLLLALFPLHYHLHHDAPASAGDATVHGHVADIHAVADADGADHHADSHVIDPPDISSGKTGAQLPVLALLLVITVLAPLFVQALRPVWLEAHLLPRSHRHTIPPLRAPPRR